MAGCMFLLIVILLSILSITLADPKLIYNCRERCLENQQPDCKKSPACHSTCRKKCQRNFYYLKNYDDEELCQNDCRVYVYCKKDCKIQFCQKKCIHYGKCNLYGNSQLKDTDKCTLEPDSLLTLMNCHKHCATATRLGRPTVAYRGIETSVKTSKGATRPTVDLIDLNDDDVIQSDDDDDLDILDEDDDNILDSDDDIDDLFESDDISDSNDDDEDDNIVFDR